MTRDELGAKLHHLDPGASLIVEEDELVRMYNVARLSQNSHDGLKTISDLALAHDCMFVFNP